VKKSGGRYVPAVAGCFYLIQFGFIKYIRACQPIPANMMETNARAARCSAGSGKPG
jgi:hypothetical protein